MKPIKVIVTSAGAGPGIAVIKALMQQKELPLEVYAMDMDSTAAGLYLAHSYVVTPSAKSASFVDFVMRYCMNNKINFIIPIFDLETPVFAKNKVRFKKEAGVSVLVNDFDVIERCNNKKKTNSFCIKHNILVPYVYSIKEIKQGSIRLPVIVKPNTGIGSKGIVIIKHRKELLAHLPFPKNLILQDFIEGIEYTIDTFSDFYGHCLTAIPRERIVVKAGQTVKGKTVNNEKIISYGKRVAELFGLQGVGCIQCKINNGKIYLIEVNPRYGTGLSLSVGAGVNLPLIHLKMALNYPVSQQDFIFKDNYFMSRYWEEVFLDGSRSKQKGVGT